VRIDQIEQIPELMAEWPVNESKRPQLDDDNARLDTERLANWWLASPIVGCKPSISSEATEKGSGWRYWFEAEHPSLKKPFRCFRVLVQHWKPPLVYQLQFPMALNELALPKPVQDDFRPLLERSEARAAAAGLRELVNGKAVKSISLYRQFPEQQFQRFTSLVTEFVNEMQVMLNRVLPTGGA
jgi:hypothetical protein